MAIRREYLKTYHIVIGTSSANPIASGAPKTAGKDVRRPELLTLLVAHAEAKVQVSQFRMAEAWVLRCAVHALKQPVIRTTR